MLTGVATRRHANQVACSRSRWMEIPGRSLFAPESGSRSSSPIHSLCLGSNDLRSSFGLQVAEVILLSAR
jgi:hypothetical protein